ncbi:MAG: hypothetical protein ACYSOT_04070, partial [Planctomycetota bacterium]
MQSANLKIAERLKQWLIPAGLCVLLLIGSPVFSNSAGGGVLRSRVYNLRNISSEQARDLFMQLNIGKSYNMLTPEVLIVTSNVGSELVTATEIINVLDQSPLVQIRTLMDASQSESLPDPAALIAALGSISAGTLTEAPAKGEARPAIVDIVDGELIAIATEDVLADIEAAAENWKQTYAASRPDNVLITAATETPEVTPEPVSVTKEPNAVENAPAPTAATDPNAGEGPEAETEEAPVVSDETPPAPEAVEPNVSAEPQPSVEATLAEVAEEVFGESAAVDEDAEPDQPEATAADEEDFLSEGLMEELASAEQAVEPTAKAPATVEDTAVEGEPAVVEEAALPTETMTEETVEAVVEEAPAEMETPEPAAEKAPAVVETTEPVAEEAPAAVEAETTEEKTDPMAMIQALLAQSKAEKAKAAAAEQEAEAVVAAEEQPEEQPEEQTAEPVTESVPTAQTDDTGDTLQAELALLRQRLAELEATAAEETAPDAAAAAESEKTAAEEVKPDTTAAKIQSAPKIADAELEVVNPNLPQEMELEALVDMVGEQLGLNYLYEQNLLKNQKVQLKVFG